MKAFGSVFKYGDNVDTDVIIPARHLATTDPKGLAAHCMEDIDTEFVKKVKDGDIMVARAKISAAVLPENMRRSLLRHPASVVSLPKPLPESSIEMPLISGFRSSNVKRRQKKLKLETRLRLTLITELFIIVQKTNLTRVRPFRNSCRS